MSDMVKGSTQSSMEPEKNMTNARKEFDDNLLFVSKKVSSYFDD